MDGGLSEESIMASQAFLESQFSEFDAVFERQLYRPVMMMHGEEEDDDDDEDEEEEDSVQRTLKKNPPSIRNRLGFLPLDWNIKLGISVQSPVSFQWIKEMS